MVRRKSIADVSDDAALAALGHQSELKRTFSPLAMLGLAFAILNSWTALSISLSLALPSGGPSSVIWGLVTSGVFNLSLALSLAEFLSAFPTAAGQLHWVAVAAPRRLGPVLSYFTGWINVGGWLALTATGGLLGSQLILGIISLLHGDFEPQRWQQFVIYVLFNAFSFVVNAFMNRLIPLVDRTAICWSLGGFVIISITILATSSPHYSSGDVVFREFINNTGWPDGVAWLLGLLQGGFGLTGYDAVAHMIEEIPNPTVEGPKVMVYCVCIGTFTGFVFLTVLLFVAGDLDQVISSAATPLLQILYNATNSYAGAICLLMFPLGCALFANVAIMTAASRMTWAFARDRGMPFSGWLGRVNERFEVPVNALILTNAVVLVFGCVFLGSSAAFNAIVSASVIALGLSYGAPVLLNCLHGRSRLPEIRAFKLPAWLGWTVNLLGIVYVTFTTVLFFFPPTLPTDADTMNYAIVAFGLWMILAVLSYVFEGRIHYTGPKTELEDDFLAQLDSHRHPHQTDDNGTGLLPGIVVPKEKGDDVAREKEDVAEVPATKESEAEAPDTQVPAELENEQQRVQLFA